MPALVGLITIKMAQSLPTMILKSTFIHFEQANIDHGIMVFFKRNDHSGACDIKLFRAGLNDNGTGGRPDIQSKARRPAERIIMLAGNIIFTHSKTNFRIAFA